MELFTHTVNHVLLIVQSVQQLDVFNVQLPQFCIKEDA